MDADSGSQRAGTQPLDTSAHGTAVLAFGPFSLDGKRRLLTANGSKVMLQPRAFDLLELLVNRSGQLLTSDEIVGHVWRGMAVGDNNLGVQLSGLRRALAECGGQGLIVTVPGRGYRFVGDVVTEPPTVPLSPDIPPPLSGMEGRRHPVGLRFLLATGASFVIVVCLATLAWRATVPSARSSQAAQLSSFNPPLRSIAVLAFANLSNDPAQDYLSDGLSEALIDVLSRVSQFQVTARTSSFYFKSRAAPIDEIARRLNVASVLEGSLRRQGTHLRIDAHLSDARTGYQIWSQSYDLEMANMLKLQDDIAGAVADALQANLVDAGPARRSLGGTPNPLAFDAYLRGEHHVLEVYDEKAAAAFGQNDAAIAEFRNATKIDPDFALALTALSGVLSWKANYTMSTAEPAYRRVREEARLAAERAAEVAPGLGLPHAQLGRILLSETADLGAAWAEALRARALSPGDAAVNEAYAQIAMDVGHREDAIRAASRATALDPLHPESWFTTMRVLICAHQFDGARDALERAITILGHAPSFAPFMIGNILLKQGKPEAARQACSNSADWTDMCLAIADHKLGRRKEAEAAAANMYADSGDDNSYDLADVHAQWNQPAIAMQWLIKARKINDPALADLECDAWLDPIRGQTAFREIEKSLHLPDTN